MRSNAPLWMSPLLLLGGCQSPCEKALDHFEHLAFEVTRAELASHPAAQALTPSFEAMQPALRKIASPRFAACDEALARCVLEAKGAAAANRCLPLPQ